MGNGKWKTTHVRSSAARKQTAEIPDQVRNDEKKESATFVRETKDGQTERRETFKMCALRAHIFMPAKPARREAPIPVSHCTRERPLKAR